MPAVAERAVQLARENGWPIRNLVCDAGIGASGPTDAFDPSAWTRIFDVNVHGSFYFIRALCWMALVELCLERHTWLTGSRNRTEEVFGTYSVASRVVGCLPLAGLWKSEVIDLCQQVGVPAEVIESSRRADPNCGRSQELAEIAFDLIDRFLRVQEGELPEAALAALNPGQFRYLSSVLRRIGSSAGFRRGRRLSEMDFKRFGQLRRNAMSLAATHEIGRYWIRTSDFHRVRMAL